MNRNVVYVRKEKNQQVKCAVLYYMYFDNAVRWSFSGVML